MWASALGSHKVWLAGKTRGQGHAGEARGQGHEGEDTRAKTRGQRHAGKDRSGLRDELVRVRNNAAAAVAQVQTENQELVAALKLEQAKALKAKNVAQKALADI